MESYQEKDLITLALRFIHVVLNSIMVFIGVVSIGYGAIIFYHSIIKANENIFFTPLTIFSIMVIAIGSTFVFISTLGCCVNICESFGLTISYVVSLLIVLLILLIGPGHRRNPKWKLCYMLYRILFIVAVLTVLKIMEYWQSTAILLTIKMVVMIATAEWFRGPSCTLQMSTTVVLALFCLMWSALLLPLVWLPECATSWLENKPNKWIFTS